MNGTIQMKFHDGRTKCYLQQAMVEGVLCSAIRKIAGRLKLMLEFRLHSHQGL